MNLHCTGNRNGLLMPKKNKVLLSGCLWIVAEIVGVVLFSIFIFTLPRPAVAAHRPAPPPLSLFYIYPPDTPTTPALHPSPPPPSGVFEWAMGRPPIAHDDSYTTSADTILDTAAAGLPGVLDNDQSPGGLTLTAVLVDDVQHGALTLAADGSFVYVPGSGGGGGGQELIPGSNSLIEYGVATAVDGDTLVVGANSHEGGRAWAGAVYVFTRQGDNWVLQAKLTADRPAVGQFFGWTVDLSGNTLVVGAPGDRQNGIQAGAAYVFTRSGSTWSQQAQLVGLDTAAYDEFAVDVAIEGDTIAIGAYLNDQNGNDAGAAYIFTRNGTTWSQQAKIVPNDPAANAWFGSELALDNETLAVSAIYGGPAGKGAAYLFTRSGTSWSQQAKVSASDGTAGDTFGFALALQGDTLVASATAYQSGSGFPGAVYLFERQGSTWSEQQKLAPADVGDDTTFGFGASVAIDGDTILVGADGDDAMAVDAGSVYPYQWDGSSWTQQQKLYSLDPQAGEAFGTHVSLHGATYVIGANSEKFSPVPDGAPGAAYVFAADQIVAAQVVNDSFTYRASNGTDESNLATVFINIVASTAPAASSYEAQRPISTNPNLAP